MELYNKVNTYHISERCDGSFITDADMGFICGLLRDKRPKKILELGVAKGGSTVDLINCINELEIECEMYSVDLSEKYFLDENLNTGYLIDEFKQKNGDISFHRMMIGKVIAQCLDEIGGDIDFVFMDTVHRIPGEIIDFLAIYPYLSKNAVIILDDLKVHYYQDKRDIACTVLFQTVTAKKYLNIDGEYPNVGAFSITEDTGKYLQDVFNSLLLPWAYIPTNEQLEAYGRIFSRYYSDEELKIWNHAKDMAIFFDAKSNNTLKVFNDSAEKLSQAIKQDGILIYGAGKRAAALYNFLSQSNISILGFTVSDGQKKSNEYLGLPVYEFSNISDIPENFLIVQAVLSEAVSVKLVSSGCNYLILSEDAWCTIEFGK